MYTKNWQSKIGQYFLCLCEMKGMDIRMGKVSLSDGEWKIMNSLWESGESTITELTASLENETGWDKHIIITMLGRMEKKEAVAHRQGGRAKVFYPLVSREEVSMQETRGFLEKVYRGSLGMMVNAMVADQALSEQEIQELYDILEQARKKG
jgi:BlaI family penicillinase repressor